MPFITMDFERGISAPAGAVNAAVQDALRHSDFHIAGQSLTTIEARRGSKVTMAMVGGFALNKIPMVARASLTAHDGGTQLAVHLADEFLPIYGQAGAAKKRYREVFAQVQGGVDAVLRTLTPAVTGQGAREWSSAGEGKILTRLAERMEGIGNTVVKRGTDIMSGDWSQSKRPWDGVEQVRFLSATGTTVLDNVEVQALMNTGTLILTRPNTLPLQLMRELELFQMQLERALGSGSRTITLRLSDQEASVLQFLRDQAALRTRLPVRTVQECTACHTKRLVNPDYERILKRNKALKNIGGGLGAGITRHSITPFVLFGRVMSFAKLDPEFVCRNCQGMSADETIVTLCPHCGKVQPQAVLKTCQNCSYDFREMLGRRAERGTVWNQTTPTPEVPIPPGAEAPPPVSP